MPKTKREYNLADCVVPQVYLKNGEECSTKRHFRGALRQVINKAEFLASHNRDRFVYASTYWFVENCKDFSTGKNYSLRQIKRAIKVATLRGIFSGQVGVVVGGVNKTGFMVKTHDEVAHTNGHICEFVTPLVAPLVTPGVTPRVTPAVTPLIAQIDVVCDTSCDTAPSLQPQVNEDGYSDERKVLPEFAKMESSPNTGNTDTSSNTDNDLNEFEDEMVGVKNQTKPCSALASLSPVQMLNLELQTLGRGKNQ